MVVLCRIERELVLQAKLFHFSDLRLGVKEDNDRLARAFFEDGLMDCILVLLASFHNLVLDVSFARGSSIIVHIVIKVKLSRGLEAKDMEKNVLQVFGNCCGQQDRSFCKNVPVARDNLFGSINCGAKLEYTLVRFINDENIVLLALVECCLHRHHLDPMS